MADLPLEETRLAEIRQWAEPSTGREAWNGEARLHVKGCIEDECQKCDLQGEAEDYYISRRWLARDFLLLLSEVTAQRQTEEDLTTAYADMHHRALDAEGVVVGLREQLQRQEEALREIVRAIPEGGVQYACDTARAALERTDKGRHE